MASKRRKAKTRGLKKARRIPKDTQRALAWAAHYHDQVVEAHEPALAGVHGSRAVFAVARASEKKGFAWVLLYGLTRNMTRPVLSITWRRRDDYKLRICQPSDTLLLRLKGVKFDLDDLCQMRKQLAPPFDDGKYGRFLQAAVSRERTKGVKAFQCMDRKLQS